MRTRRWRLIVGAKLLGLATALSAMPSAHGQQYGGTALNEMPTDCPTVCDPVSNIPNFFGSLFGRGAQVTRTIPGINVPVNQTLTFTGRLNEGNDDGVNYTFTPLNGTVNGPGGPYVVNTNINAIHIVPFGSDLILNENAQLTGQILANFPSAQFVNGTGFTPTQVFQYFYSLAGANGQASTPDQVFRINLPNPAGGGLVGRNDYFANGSVLPRDRFFFDYNHVGRFNVLGQPADINRFVAGAEMTFLDGAASFEARVPFAGTINSSQVLGSGLAVNNLELGNVGLLTKVAFYRTPTTVATVGLGVSLPTADDSKWVANGQSILEIRNRSTIIQPLVGIAYAPNDQYYAQAGVQFNFDPNGSPVYARNAANRHVRLGTLRDQTYASVSTAAGYWVYQSDAGFLQRVALQSELHYYAAFGPNHSVQSGGVQVADLNNRLNLLTGTIGVNTMLGDRTTFAVGISAPLTGGKQFNYGVIAQLNYRFGASR